MNLKLILAFGADATIVLGFAAAGRSTHDSGGSTSATLTTAAPFLIGLLIGWAVVLLTGLSKPTTSRSLTTDISNPLSPLSGLLIWATTLIVGMGLRVLLGGTAAVPFILVAMVVLGAGLIGWRLVSLFVGRHRSDNSVIEPSIHAT